MLREIGLLQASQGHQTEALSFYRRSAQASLPENDQRSASRAYQYMAELYRQQGQVDSSIFYARRALALAYQLPFVVGILRNSTLLTQAFEEGHQLDSALRYMHVMLTAQNSLYDPRRIKQLDAIGFAEQNRLLELEAERRQLLGRLRSGALLAGVAGLLLASLLLWRSNRRKQRANQRLQELHAQLSRQADELTEQRDNLIRTLKELKIAQGQLVLRERMASLGELMAGVAHEIQQPVSNVRRFAAVSAELCQELRQEGGRRGPDAIEPEVADEMLRNLEQNQRKILLHSQRAESIVRGMLEYSQGGGGSRQLTDINALAEEYLRLVYHDLRAKNRYFNVALLLRLDPAVERLSVVRQDLGRALVGIFSAALLAVQQRQQTGEEDYVPQVELSTRRTAVSLEIRVCDNGPDRSTDTLGILFQRFPAGTEGGLSLALSHDLVTRGHGGTLTASSAPGQGTEYCITLPLPPTPTA